jgi:hypothetical protein
MPWKAARPPSTFYGESLRVNTARSLPSGRQSKAASRAALSTRCEIGDSLVRARVYKLCNCVCHMPCEDYADVCVTN